MRVLLLGDIGLEGGLLHVGDEAMFSEAVSNLRERGATLYALSATPDESIERYGLDRATGRIDFSARFAGTLAERDERLDKVIRTARGETGLIAWDDPAWAVIESVTASDAVLITGGGNLSSQWPEHVYERAALGQLAELFGKPLVISGQTVGPALTGRDGELVGALLSSARLVGVREARSYEVATELGATRVVRTLDDAAYLGEAGHPEATPSRDPYVLVTLAPYAGSTPPATFASRTARLLDEVAAVTGLEVLLLPHVGSVLGGEPTGDAVVHEAVRDASASGRLSLLPVVAPREAARLTREAAFSISTRYHPAVFAASGGVPWLTISVDEYTDAKLAGHAANFGLTESALSSISLATEDARDTFIATWENREPIRDHLLALRERDLASVSAWWDAVTAALAGGQPIVEHLPAADGLSWLDSRLAERNASLREWVRDQGRDRVGTAIAGREAEESRARLELDLLGAHAEIGQLASDLELAQHRAAEAEAGLMAAQDLVASVAEPMFKATLRSIPPSRHEQELQAVLNTRTFRWSRGARAVYARLRSRRR